ncbi:DUF2341 domain-containing protein [Acidaminobacter hydrogenoformans]|uniref:Concanavalin A-like lectin/glucanases superfamily protein n=1 Tax=Acidaminobacter hydrogenoformans DSM 2784 TaxID=1120920 RepID=A0A1G5S267_9FIRM|nr:DUF2341 domain-containing protein [Acidaminobacter hydrogenoformans]SCZ80403.1 Concanavalin A-like lectin/glucanases superfamily protein [Acidaminobacter hydrogenoformans DSM 2784]
MAWLSGYSYRKKITIESGYVDASLSNFVLDVVLASGSFTFSRARSDGYDVVFTASDGETALPFTREYYDSTNSKARFHIKVSSVSDTTDTELYMYYGKASDTDHASSGYTVWSESYAGVWHLGDTSYEDALGTYDASLLSGSTPSVTDTLWGRYLTLSSHSFGTDLAMASLASNDEVTVTIVMAWTGSGTFIPIEYSDAFYENSAFAIYLNNYGDGYPTFGECDGSNINIIYDATDCSDGTLRTLTFTMDRSGGGTTTNYSYINGVATGSRTQHGDYQADTTGNLGTETLYFGSDVGVVSPFSGTFGDLRLSTIKRSAAWIKAESYSIRQLLHSLGNEETPITPKALIASISTTITARRQISQMLSVSLSATASLLYALPPPVLDAISKVGACLYLKWT